MVNVDFIWRGWETCKGDCSFCWYWWNWLQCDKINKEAI